MKRLTALATAALVFAVGISTVRAQQNLYWDTNGTAAGFYTSPAFADGTWDNNAATTPSTNWTTDPTGVAAPIAWNDAAAPRDNAIFLVDGASDNDTINPDGLVAVATGPRNVGTMTIGNGTTDKSWVALSGAIINVGTGVVINDGSRLSMEIVGTPATPAYAGPLQMGANPITIKQGAMLSYSNQTQITAAAGQTITFDGGTIRNTIVGVGSTFYGAATATKFLVTANGGTINTPNGSGADTINGAYSIMAYGNATNALSTIGLDPSTTTGTMRKTGHGELRPFNSTNLTEWDVQSGFLRAPGGATDSAFGAPTGTVRVAGGAVANTSNGAAIGTTAALTGANASPATRSFVLTGIGDTLDSAFVLNANWDLNGNISGAGGLMLSGWSRNDGAFGSDGNNAISAQNVELKLGGTNTYAGKTTINFATLAAQGGNAIPDTSQVVFSTQSDWGVAAAPAVNHRTYDTAVLRLATSETVGSLAGGNSVRGSVNINGAAVTLTTGADGTTSTFSGSLVGAGGLAKTGGGTFTMDGAKSYTGNTTVSGGTLSTNSASLADAADVLLTTGAFFNLNFAGTDAIHSLLIDNVLQSAGVWGRVGSGAAHESARITGDGLLNAAVGPGAGVLGDFNSDGKVDSSDYATWRKSGAGPLPNDGGASDQAARYTLWRSNFGNPPGAGSGLSGGAVPEPGTLVLAIVGLAMAVAGGRRR